ncbi:MAG: PhoH family protein [Bacteroidales bacterium]|nr:PhoH family protein [Bacteroidales bacterium]
MVREPKIFVLDTNIILHDYRSMYNFQENDLYIPITVIEELDKFKKGNDTLAFNARSFIREIDRLSNNSLFDQGVSIGPGKGKIKVEMGHPFSEEYADALAEDIPDHRIIATALWLRDKYPERKVALVTKDMNMRLKARAMGLVVQDYMTDRIDEAKIEKIQKEVTTIRKVKGAVIQRFQSEGQLAPVDLNIKRKLLPNQLFRIYAEDNSLHLGRFDIEKKAIIRITKETALNITPRNEEQAFAMEAILNPDIKLISITGAAGSGKTLLALAGALSQRGQYQQIILSKPIIPLLEKNIVLIPDNIENKVAPFLLPLYDNLNLIKNSLGGRPELLAEIDRMIKEEKLLITPLAYARGRSLNNVCFIIDEAQNLTPHEMKTIISRAGDNTKIIFCGDIFQIDQPYLDIHSNGLSLLGEKFFGQAVFEHINMAKGERSELSKLACKLL